MIIRTLQYKDSKIKILADEEKVIDTVYEEVVIQRTIIENYADEEFLSSLVPVEIKKNAPLIIKEMTIGAKIAGVGQMATVAGVIAEFAVKRAIAVHKPAVLIVENGGDIFAYTKKKINVGLFSGENKLKDKLCFGLTEGNTPVSICSSSSVMGHSLSFGKCDLAVVLSEKASVADGLCTAAANKVKGCGDIKEVLEWLVGKEYFLGAVIIVDDKIGMIGDVPRLMKNEDLGLEGKVTRL